VQPLVDGDHQAEVLERAADDLVGGHVDQLGQLGHGQVLVDADGLRLLGRDALALGFALDTARCLFTTVTALLAACLQLRHDAGDVLLHRVLVDPTLALLLLVLLAGRTALLLAALLRCRRAAATAATAAAAALAATI